MPWNPFKKSPPVGMAKAQRAPDTRESSTARGYGSRWQRYREQFLAEHPLCLNCLSFGRYEPATVVDHIVPVAGARDPGFWKKENHQGLCHACHNLKTAADKAAGKTRNRIFPADGADKGTDGRNHGR